MKRLDTDLTFKYASAISWCMNSKHRFSCHAKLAELLFKEFTAN